MADPLTDQHLAWVRKFIGIDLLGPAPPDDADAQRTASSASSPGSAAAAPSGLLDRIKGDMKNDAALAKDIADLSRLDMDSILDTIEALKATGQLDDFREHIPNDSVRVGTALLTITQDFDDFWQASVAKMDKPDRAAILKRAPEGIYTGPAAPGEPSDDDGNRSVQTDNVTKLETLATITVWDGITKNKIGSLQFTVHVGANATLTNFESDLTAFEKSFHARFGDLPFKVTASLSLNNEIKFNTNQQRQVTIDTVETHLKGALEVAAKGVKFRLEAKADDHGVTFEPVLEVPF